MLLMATKGPVFWVRDEIGGRTGAFIDDWLVQLVFVVVGLVAIGASRTGWPALLDDRITLTLVLAFVMWIGVSTAWSVTPSRTIEQAVMLAVGSVAALSAGAAFSRFETLVALVMALQVGVVVSVWADVRNWALSVDRNGDLAGIYFNRNSLGPVALTAAVASLVWCLDALRRYDRSRRAPIVIGFGAVIAADLAVWQASGSLTTAFGFVAAAIATVILLLARPGPRRSFRRAGAATLAVLSLFGLGLLAFGRDWLTERFDRSSTLSGRTVIWDVVFEFIADRPLQGWGFMAVWRQPAIAEELASRGRGERESHSGFLEVLLGAGIVGLLLLLAIMALAAWRSGVVAWQRPEPLVVWSFTLVVYVIAVNTGETYVGANLLPWILLCVVLGQSVRPARQVQSGNSRSVVMGRDVS